jgi:predicted RNA-binding Zn-ribbon protein involved in translation (DUF1610 family)
MKIEDIELHVGQVDFPYRAIRELRAKCEASHAFMPAPTETEVNAKLRGMAAKVGANAVVNVNYNSGVSMTSWKSMTGTGLAVVRESDDVICPHCAEQIKRKAKKCRFCGEIIESETFERSAIEPTSESLERPSTALPPPLEETNNPVWWMFAVGAVLLFFLLISLGG